jgi:hypothetical protein
MASQSFTRESNSAKSNFKLDGTDHLKITSFQVTPPFKSDLFRLKTATPDNQFLHRDRQMLQILKDKNMSGRGFPVIVSRILDDGVIIEQLGPSLHDLIKVCPISINEASIYYIITQLVNRLEELHKIGYYHGNVCTSSVYFA